MPGHLLCDGRTVDTARLARVVRFLGVVERGPSRLMVLATDCWGTFGPATGRRDLRILIKRLKVLLWCRF